MTPQEVAAAARQFGFHSIANTLDVGDDTALALFAAIQAAVADDRVSLREVIRPVSKALRAEKVPEERIYKITKHMWAPVDPHPGLSQVAGGPIAELLQAAVINLPPEIVEWLTEDKRRADALATVFRTALRFDGTPRSYVYTTAPIEADYTESITEARFTTPASAFIENWPELHWRMVSVLDSELDQQKYRWSRFDNSEPWMSYWVDDDPRAAVARRQQDADAARERRQINERERSTLANVKSIRQLQGWLDHGSPFKTLGLTDIRRRMAELEAIEADRIQRQRRDEADAHVSRYVILGPKGQPHLFLSQDERHRNLLDIYALWGRVYFPADRRSIKSSTSLALEYPPDVVWDRAAEEHATIIRGFPGVVWGIGRSAYSDYTLLDSRGRKIAENTATYKAVNWHEPHVEIDAYKPGKVRR